MVNPINVILVTTLLAATSFLSYAADSDSQYNLTRLGIGINKYSHHIYDKSDQVHGRTVVGDNIYLMFSTMNTSGQELYHNDTSLAYTGQHHELGGGIVLGEREDTSVTVFYLTMTQENRESMFCEDECHTIKSRQNGWRYGAFRSIGFSENIHWELGLFNHRVEGSEQGSYGLSSSFILGSTQKGLNMAVNLTYDDSELYNTGLTINYSF